MFDRIRFEVLQVHELKHGGMRRFKIDGCGATALKSGFPTRDANTPTISRFQSGKTPFGHWCHEIVPVEDRKIEEFLSYFHANGMQADVLGARAAITIAIKPGHRIAATATQLGAEDIRWHGDRLAHPGSGGFKTPLLVVIVEALACIF
jgi:hypothetical protein